ncbi:MAG: hypothetical protein WBA93_19990 [Microcoleaceae cyanobacterium]
MAASEDLEIDLVFEPCPNFFHTHVIPIVANKEYAIENNEILAAIANHTPILVRYPYMSKLGLRSFSSRYF